MMTPTLAHVHETHEGAATIELSPPHPPRVETPEYARAHKFLVYTKNAPCLRCGVTRRTLKNPAKNPMGAKALETHHFPIERSLMDACDPAKVHKDFPQVYDRATLAAFVDSPGNLIVLCDQHHRSLEHGIHHQLVQDWAVGPYLLDGYIIAATAQDATQAEAVDERIMQADGLEPAADAASLTPSSDGAASVSALAGERSSPTASTAQPVTAPASASVSGAGVSVRAGVAPGRPSVTPPSPVKTRAPRTPGKRAQA